MSHHEKHVYDIATENKLRKADANAKRKAEDESLAHHVRRHELYELCGGDMLRFRMMLDVLSDRGLIDEAIIDEADARPHRHAAGYPVTAPVKKIESLRAELWREPDPVLAALLERDAFVCVSGARCSPMVYYGSGCLTDYKARVLSPDAMAPCPMAGSRSIGSQAGISDPATTSAWVADLPDPGLGADTPLPGAEHAGREMPLEA